MKRAGSNEPARATKAERRPGVLPTVGIIVEGDAEFAALPLLHRRSLVPRCPPLRPINLGGVGSDRKPIGIAKLVAPKVIQLHAARCERIVVCFDREQRAECAPGLAQAVARELATELAARGKSIPEVHVVIADRAFEAWLLADAAGLHERGLLSRAPTFHSFEGQLGAQGRKGVVELSRLLGRDYSKTKDGPALFEKLSFANARAHRAGERGSPSLDKLLRALGV